MDTKPFYTSKLNWLGAFMALAGLFAGPDAGSLLGGFVPAEYVPKIMSAAGLLVIVLRTFATSTSITVGKPKDNVIGVLLLAVWMVCMVTMLSGCATITTKQSIPADCEHSVIYATAQHRLYRLLWLLPAQPGQILLQPRIRGYCLGPRCFVDTPASLMRVTGIS